jgi:hypothetical protein
MAHLAIARRAVAWAHPEVRYHANRIHIRRQGLRHARVSVRVAAS